MSATKIIFTTIHGSHLYGMAHEGSDMDTFVVTNSARGARQKVFGGEDSVRIGFSKFMEYAYNGSHQSLEAMFSTRKVWNEEFLYLKPMLENFRAGGPWVLAKYQRTIKAFAYSDDFKRRRHACRLWINMQGLRSVGWFDPTLQPQQIIWATELAQSSLSGDALYGMLQTGESAL